MLLLLFQNVAADTAFKHGATKRVVIVSDEGTIPVQSARLIAAAGNRTISTQSSRVIPVGSNRTTNQ